MPDTELSLSDVFHESLSGDARLVIHDANDELAAWLASCIEAACLAWPTLTVSAADFARHLATRLERPDSLADFRALRTDDLFLASACLRLEPHALAAFEERYKPVIERALGRMRVPRDVGEDVKAQLREQLFFARSERAPLLADYTGKGELRTWVRSVAVRVALKLLARERRHTGADEGESVLVSAPSDPESMYLKRLYRREFKDALRSALGSMSPAERTLLRQHYLDGLTLDALARIRGAHRATVARWLAATRKTLREGVRRSLARRLRLSDRDFDSIVRMVESGESSSLARAFCTPTPT
jgi:RNA polymerase sigma-70 factor (ECF subfamily)